MAKKIENFEVFFDLENFLEDQRHVDELILHHNDQREKEAQYA